MFAVSNGGIQWSLEFRLDSVILTAVDLVQEMTINSQEIPLPVWNLSLSQKHFFLYNLSVEIPITPNHQGIFEMRDKILANAGAQVMDTSGSEPSDLEDIDSFWEDPQVELDDVIRPAIDTLFSPTALNDLEVGERGSSENPIVLDEEEDKGNSLPTTPLFEGSTEPPRLLRGRPFKSGVDNMPEYIYRTLFQ